MKIFGYLLLLFVVAGFTTAWLHLYAQLHLGPASAWVNWFGRLPLSAGPYSHRLPILLGSSMLLFGVGLRLVNPRRNPHSRNEDRL